MTEPVAERGWIIAITALLALLITGAVIYLRMGAP